MNLQVLIDHIICEGLICYKHHFFHLLLPVDFQFRLSHTYSSAKMVKKKSGRTLNPADAHRKAMRQKEIKKNKAERKRVRTLVMVHKDTTKLEEEVWRYKALDREKRLDKNGKGKLKDLQDKLSKILETKKLTIHLRKDNKPRTDHTPIYFHPTLNPSGLPPPGILGQLPGENIDEDEDESESSDDEDHSEGSDSEAGGNEEESEEEIPLPPGLPPANESSDDLPDLPPGPPPVTKDNSDDDDDDEEDEDNDLPELPSGPPPTNLQVNNHLTRTLPPPFGYGAPSTGPIFSALISSNPFATFSGPPGTSNNIRSQMRPPPPPPFPGAFAVRPPPPPILMHQVPVQAPFHPPHPYLNSSPSITRPLPINSLYSHYGPPPPGVQLNSLSRPYPPSPGTPNSVSGMPLANLSPSKMSLPSKPAASAAIAIPIIQAEPQVRNLQKELTILVPSAVLRKKAAAAKTKVVRPMVNAAPNIDDGTDVMNPPVKRAASTTLSIVSQQVSQEESQDLQKSAAPPAAKKAKTKKKYDEYEKFMTEMQDLL
ncbi:hypothetical protein G9A89_012540 [Geosiphon pyriformis]|nr:hypothetical protein G9A89_012540 [Geosiphon pyriformis]